MTRPHLLLTVSLCALLIVIGTADVIFVEGLPSKKAEEPIALVPPPEKAPVLPHVQEKTSSGQTSPEAGVQKLGDHDIASEAAKLGLTTVENTERTLIAGIQQPGDQLHSLTLLQDGDRAGMITWLDSPRVKIAFLALKESLHTLFSPKVQDLLDENQRPVGKPPRNFLTFLDPELSEERFVLVRIRERLFEVHIAPGKEEKVYKLIEALSE